MRLSKDTSGTLIDSATCKLFTKAYYVVNSLSFRDSVNSIQADLYRNEISSLRYAIEKKDSAFVKVVEKNGTLEKTNETQKVKIITQALWIKILGGTCLLQLIYILL